MAKKLYDCFPMIRTRKEVLEEIKENKNLMKTFDIWKEDQQEEFLDFCTGMKGVKLLYDSFFKEIFNPEYHAERVEALLSLLLGKTVHICQVLPNDSVRIADEECLLITDILVELEDKSLANIEIQKIGYAFPGQRLACYSADTLLRQYKRVKNKRNNRFTYREIKTVYTIVFFEKSSQEFHKTNEHYIHKSKQVFDTGLELETLQEYILITLDIFKETMHNKSINNKLDAWLAIIAYDEPEQIMQLIDAYPECRSVYEDLYDMCLNIEGVMNMYSKELAELDRNTVRYMIEEQEKLLEEKDAALKAKNDTIAQQAAEIARLRKQLE